MGMHNFSFKEMLVRAFLFVWRFVKEEFVRGRFTPLLVPTLSLEVTNFCNSHCVFCPNPIMKRPRQHLDMGLFKKAVDEFIIMGGTRINFCTCIGEPLLDPYLIERVRYIKQYPQIKYLDFITMLSWLHHFDIDEFCDSGITAITISTVLSGREKYHEVFGIDIYEQTLKNILMLIEVNRRKNNKIDIYFSIKPTNEPLSSVLNHPDFKRVNYLMDNRLMRCIEKRNFYYDDWCGTIKLPSYIPKRPLYPKWFRPCGLLYTNIAIFSNGKIGICNCRDFEANSELILGDIRTDSLLAIWSGPVIARLRYNWRKRNIAPSICKRCSHYGY